MPREVLALLALPPLWSGSGRDRRAMLADLCEALEAVLRVDLAYAIAAVSKDEARIEVLRLDGRDASEPRGALHQALADCCEGAPEDILTLDLPRLGPVHVLYSPLGPRAEHGHVLAGSRRREPLDEAAKAVLRAATSMAAASLTAARVHAEREAEKEVLATMLRTSRQLASELDLGALMQKVTDEARRLCRAELGAFFFNQVGPYGETCLLFTVSGAPRSEFEKFPLPRMTRLFAPTFRGEAVLRLADVRKDPRYGKNPPYHGLPPGHPPVVSYMSVPVKLSTGEVLGGLFLGHSREGVFQQRDEDLVVALAAQAAVAADNARLYERARTAAALEERRARLAEEVGRTMTSSVEMSSKLQRVAQAIVDHLDAAFARVWTYDEGPEVLQLRASAGLYTHLDGAHARVPLGQLKIGRIARERRALLTNDVPNDPHIGDPAWARREGLVAFAGYPLFIGERLLGVLALFSRQRLSPEAFKGLGNVADLLSVSLERERAEIEREQFRELFLGMLAHDLQNPLGTIRTGAQLVARASLDDRSRKIVERVVRSADRMSRMITQLLDFTRARYGVGIPVERVRCDLYDICREVVEELRTTHPDRVIALSFAGTGEGEWDQDRMAQVFSNLVGNALQHSREQTEVAVRMSGEGDEVCCSVRSQGEPIPEDKRAALFDPFRRGPTHRRDSATQGLGLGLFITKHILAAHGGRIDVTSTVEGGTVFEIRVPRHCVHPREA